MAIFDPQRRRVGTLQIDLGLNERPGSLAPIVGDDLFTLEVQLCMTQSALPCFSIPLAFYHEILMLVAEGRHKEADFLLDCLCGLGATSQDKLDRLAEHGMGASIAHLYGSKRRSSLPHDLGKSALRGGCSTTRYISPRSAQLCFQGSESGNSTRIHLTAETGKREHVAPHGLNQPSFVE